MMTVTLTYLYSLLLHSTRGQAIYIRAEMVYAVFTSTFVRQIYNSTGEISNVRHFLS